MALLLAGGQKSPTVKACIQLERGHAEVVLDSLDEVFVLLRLS